MPRFSLLALGLTLTAAVPVSASAESFRVLTGGFGPQNEVRVAKPTFKWEIWPADRPADVTGIDFRINGSAVKARYDATGKSVIYTPSKPLSKGSHRVDVEVTFDKAYRFTKSWTAVVRSDSTTELAEPSTAQRQTMIAVNALRAKLGLPGFEMDDRLNAAAAAHSDYLAANNLMGHYQRKGTTGFLGETSADRVGAFGWSGGSWEGVTYGSRSIAEGVRHLFDAPYHRLPFLQPGQVAFGSGFTGTRMTMEFGMGDNTGTVISPANGETGVPVRWHNAESPDPMRIHDGRKETGYPIVLAHFDGNMGDIQVSRASLTANGSTVPVLLNTPANDNQLQFAAILFPKAALKPGMSYTATFEGKDARGRKIEVKSTFKTAQ